MLDPGCSDPLDDDESDDPVVLPECSDGEDNDGDGMIDFAGLLVSSTTFSVTLNDPDSTVDLVGGSGDKECNDGVDNDGDGETDFPQDASCSGLNDNTEGAPRQCADGADNDGDGKTDHPADSDCENGSDNSEGATSTPDYQYYVFTFNVDGIVVSMPVQVLEVDSVSGILTLRLQDGTLYYLNVGDTVGVSAGSGVTNYIHLVSISGLTADVTVYSALSVPPDPGCSSPDDDDESDDPVTYPQCNDGKDNDGDGKVDMLDPGCDSPTDDDEFNYWTQCDDGIDNDGDGKVDFPEDPGCTSLLDDLEFNSDAQCSDNIDNDLDGFTDWPADPGCKDVFDDSEHDIITQCNDGVDNDGDGLTDHPADPHCSDPEDPFEGEIDVSTSDKPFRDMDDLLVTRIDIDGHDIESAVVRPGSYFRLSTGLQNNLDYTLDDIKVDMSIQELGIRDADMLRELDPDDSATVVLNLDIPYWAQPGLYDLRIVVSNDDVRRVKYRVVAIA
jgi:hypothetical protein